MPGFPIRIFVAGITALVMIAVAAHVRISWFTFVGLSRSPLVGLEFFSLVVLDRRGAQSAPI